MSILLVNSNAERIPLADGVVHAVVTSPPYYGLRKYAVDEEWIGGNPECDHAPREQVTNSKTGTNLGSLRDKPSRVCRKCGAVLSNIEIGLEDTPELYLERMVAVFREVRRVLRDDGVCFVNMGDSYAHGEPGGGSVFDNGRKDGRISYDTDKARGRNKRATMAQGYKPLDLMNIPSRLVLALQADGWYHRSTIIWSKPNPMPESVSGWRWERHRVKVRNLRNADAVMSGNYSRNDVGEARHIATEIPWAEYTDCPGCEKCEPHGGLVLRRGSWRPTTAHEYIFMLTKTAGYWADGEAVREAAEYGFSQTIGNGFVSAGDNNRGHRTVIPGNGSSGRNARTVWDFPTQPWSGAHFATYPEELPRRCLKASISERGCCPKCGAQWARVVEKSAELEARRNVLGLGPKTVRGGNEGTTLHHTITTNTLGWLPTCDCGIEDTAPPIVLDPFAGSGTTGLVARELGAHFIGLDLSFAYLHEQARSRLGLTALDAWSKGKGKQDGKVITDLPLFQEVE